MKKIAVIACLLLLSAPSSFAQNDLPASFADLLSRARMSFTAPEGYTEVDIVENPHMSYDYALRHPTAGFEIRYTVRPMDVVLQDYERLISEGATMIHPNNWLPMSALATFANIGGDIEGGGFGPLPEEGVKVEFNADSGLAGACEPREEFSCGYKYCIMNFIFKKDTGTAYTFFMADDLGTLAENFSLVFHCLKFEGGDSPALENNGN